MPQPFADEIRSIPMSAPLGDSLERARGFAREQSHRTVTLEHLLLAFTEDPDAAAVLQASNIDLLRLGTEVSGYLSRLPDDTGPQAEGEADPLPDGELVRVLQAAVQAAQQSRRRQIDGAIVLAAVVGDGKSPAAALLKAHGLTFEEAIRALQKTSAKASAQARSKQYAAAPRASIAASDGGQAATSAAPAQQDTAPPPAQSATPPSANGRAAEGVGQTVEDILAAARARIEQRAAAINQPAKPAAAAPAPAPEPPPSRVAPPPDLPSPPAPPTEAPRQAEEPSPAPPTPTAPPPAQHATAAAPQPAAPGPRPWPPPAPSGPSSARPLPQPSQGQRTAPPFARQALRPGEGPARPPLPGGRIEPGLPPPRPAAAGPMPPPWPSPDPPAPNGAAHPDAHLTAPAPRRPAQRTGGQPGKGPLVESIPRRMRVGVTATAQVRVSRERVDGLILLLTKAKGASQRPEGLMARALTVRLTAPDSGFWIEAMSQETQWAEAATGGRQQDGHLTWRWSVTPQERGRGKLQLVVTARTVGRDGAVAETAPPDRTIEVTVTGGRLAGLRRWIGVLFTLAVGAVIGRFAGDVWAMAAGILKRVAG